MTPVAALRPPRLILVDDNIRNTGGHYFELASLLLTGAQEIGYQAVLAPHRQFDPSDAADSRWQLIPTFQTRRLVDWSLGVDGHSTTCRDINGHPIGGNKVQNVWNRVRDQISRPTRRPAAMLRRWSRDLAGLLQRIKPNTSDVLLVNTADDFAMLALAAAMQQVDCPPLRVDAIFHFALVDAGQSRYQIPLAANRETSQRLFENPAAAPDPFACHDRAAGKTNAASRLTAAGDHHSLSHAAV